MIPNITIHTIQLGPITLQIWGLFVSLGILLGALLSAKFAEKRGLDKEVIYSAGFWIIVGAFIGARLFHVLVYNPGLYLSDPIQVLKIWQGGLSVIGGFLGAIGGYYFYTKKHTVLAKQYIDPLIYGLPLGLGCGRIGCFLIHDHPGTLTNSPLGIDQGDGTSIHDHGLYLSINGFVLAILFFLLQKKKRHPGFFAQLFLVWYGIVRFFLDFYRIIDVTYFGLTPAQYLSLIMVVSGGIWYYVSSKKLELDAHN